MARDAKGRLSAGPTLDLHRSSEVSAADPLAVLRARLPSIAPYPAGCVAFDGRPTMNGTAFFPGGDGLWKPNPGDRPTFPIGGVLVLGSDFGDCVSYDSQFERDVVYRSELDGGTWPGLLKVIDLAGIPRTDLFCTNAWPCLREGDEPVKGGIPGARDAGFTARCLAFLKFTLGIMKPCLVLPLGKAPTAFIAMLDPVALRPWVGARSWRHIDRMPIGKVGDMAIVPLVHPSMPNRRHRLIASTVDAESALIRAALKVLRLPILPAYDPEMTVDTGTEKRPK